MKLPRLKIGDCLYATSNDGTTTTVTITGVDRDTFFAKWPNGRPEGVSRRQLRTYGLAYGDDLVIFKVTPPDRPALHELVARSTIAAEAGDIREAVGITEAEFAELDRAVVASVAMRALSMPEMSQGLRDALTPDDAFALGATILMFAERRLAAVLLQRAEGDLLHNLASLGSDGTVH